MTLLSDTLRDTIMRNAGRMVKEMDYFRLDRKKLKPEVSFIMSVSEHQYRCDEAAWMWLMGG